MSALPFGIVVCEHLQKTEIDVVMLLARNITILAPLIGKQRQIYFVHSVFLFFNTVFSHL